VALISSGDAGVYGMAGPTFEVLFQAGWTPDSGIEVEIIPGASALNTCAALVGAPLTHDFCAISLSDLLTPWPTIARRLDAVAYADFVVALYNPKSGRRTRQIGSAAPFPAPSRSETPVAIVKSAYRPKQRIEFTTLEKMNECRHRHAVHRADRQFQHLRQTRPDGHAARLRQQVRRRRWRAQHP
jgi:precorrin-3B C17-methyltransferase